MLNQLSDTQLTVAMSLFPDPNPEIVRQALDRAAATETFEQGWDVAVQVLNEHPKTAWNWASVGAILRGLLIAAYGDDYIETLRSGGGENCTACPVCQVLRG